MRVDKSLILNKIKSYKGFRSDAEFARFLEISPQGLASWHKRNSFDINKIEDKIPELNTTWLLTGEGDMLKHIEESKTTEPQPGDKAPYQGRACFPVSRGRR